MPYIRTDFHLEACTESACDIVSAFAAAQGYDSFEYTPQGVAAYIPAEVFSESVADGVVADLRAAGIIATAASEPLPDQDWNADWEAAGFEPIAIDDALLVIDERHPPSSSVQERFPMCISIRATQAFGTATHATTQMMLRGVLRLSLTGKTVVDCGTGTGILAIAAARLGAERVIALDIDRWSTDCARHNADANGAEADIRLGDIGTLCGMDGEVDMVLANINRNVLLHDMSSYARLLRPDGVLLLSGFQCDDADIIREAAAGAGLTEVNEDRHGDWMVLSFIKHSTSLLSPTAP